MQRKNLARIVTVLALTLLGFSLYAGVADEASSRLYEHVMYDRPAISNGSSDSLSSAYDIDEIIDVTELVQRLADGHPEFDWIDWLDLDKTKLYETGQLNEQLYPYLSELSKGELPAMPYEVQAPPQEQAMIGRLYCKWHLSSPSRVIPIGNPDLESVNYAHESDNEGEVESGGDYEPKGDDEHAEPESSEEEQFEERATDDDASFNLLLSDNGLRTAPVVEYCAQHTDANRRHRQFGHQKPTKYTPVSGPIVSDLKKPMSDLTLENLLFPKLDASLFDWNVHNYVKGSRARESHSDGQDQEKETEQNDSEDEQSNDKVEEVHEEDHILTLERASEAVSGSKKYFHEVWIQGDEAGYGVHYDWRFFRSIMPFDEHRANTHILARAWQQFAEQMGIAYWYAHGSLLGYYWNGMAMPWDTDHDIQVPVMELDRLARDFNRSLIVQHHAEGYRKFLLDVTPWYVERRHGNGQNVIDARFVDVDTGAYIDITGLARASPNMRTVSCKNGHMYKVNALERLRRTSYEGYPAIVPLNMEKALRREYRSYAKATYKNWRYNQRLRLWEFQQTCEEYLKSFRNSRHVYCIPRRLLAPEDCPDGFDTCDAITLQDYNITQGVTQSHLSEIETFKNIGPIDEETDWTEHEESLEILVDMLGTYVRPFRNSTFDVAPATIPKH